MLLVALASKSHARVMIVGSASFVDNSLTLENVKDAFLGRAPKTSDRQEIVPIDRAENEFKTRAQFLQIVLGWNSSRFKSFWSQLVFTGKGESLLVASSRDQLIEFLDKTPSSISFMDISEKSDRVKVLLTLENLN